MKPEGKKSKNFYDKNVNFLKGVSKVNDSVANLN